MPINVLIVDDEPLARRRIARLLRAEPDVDVVGECGTGREAVEALKANDVDLVFLDVQMPDLDGFDVVAEVGAEKMPSVIFVTAYNEYALKAFEVHAVDYLLKPVEAERFQRAFQRAREFLGRKGEAQSGRRLKALLSQLLNEERIPDVVTGEHIAPHPSRYVDRIMVKTDGRVLFVKVNDVDWFEAAGNYIRLHAQRQTYMIRETMNALESSLNPSQFARIHRATIVNLDRIRELQPWFAGDYVVLLHDGSQLKLTRTYRDQLQARMHHAPSAR